jgi:c-di-GMP-binding flagellar brake protein YcgR
MFSSEQNNSERRRFPRADFREPVSFRFSGAPESGGCLGKDISEGGLRINFENFVRPHTPMAFEFRLTQGSQVMLIQGHVAWSHRVPSSDRYQLGVEFVTKDDENQQNIRKFVISNQIK